jgi:ribose transport system permease protein
MTSPSISKDTNDSESRQGRRQGHRQGRRQTMAARLANRFRTTGIENLGLYAVFVLVFIYFSFASPYFLATRNLFDVLRQSTFVLTIGLGMSFVIFTAGIDLSVGSILGLSAGITSVILLQGLPTGIAVLGGLATGFLCGAINGLIITRLGVTDFIATLATLSAFRGVLFTMTQGVPFAAFARPSFSFIGRGTIGPVPTPIIIVVVIFFILNYIKNKTAFGRHVLAVGSNLDAARLSGVRTKSIKLWVYILSGLTSATAGIMLASRLSTVPPDLGTGYELASIASVVIGGTSLFGGRGSLIGTVVGAVLIAMISNGLILLDVNPFYQYVINGILIVFAVAINRKK